MPSQLGLARVAHIRCRKSGKPRLAVPSPGTTITDACHYFFSLRLPDAYSLSSQITHFPSCATYLEMSGTVFCP